MTIFADKTAAVTDLRANQLMLASQTHLSDMTLSDDYLYSKLLAAESEASKILRVFLEPTMVLPADATQAEIDALDAAHTRYVLEPGYDYDPEMFTGNTWGFIALRQKPVIAVTALYFQYPSPQNTVFQVPVSWVRLDRKYGHIQLVPAAASFSAPLSAFMMQAMGGGRTIPFMLQVRYTAGIKNVQAEYPEVVMLIKRLAVLNVLKDSFVPQSGSISADGLSQSISLDVDKYMDSTQQSLDRIRDEIHGVRLGVF